MARDILCRFRLTGTLVATTPLHVGGHGDDVDTDLPLARDGRGDLYVPGTSIAGALRQWCEQAYGEDSMNAHWGFQNGDQGHASFVIVEDLPVNEASAVVVEVRDGVGIDIDRRRGAAAENIKYDRAILPRGTRLTFALSAEAKDSEQRLAVLAMLAALKEAMDKAGVRLGASKTRGLGRVKLEDGKLVEEKFNDRQGILAFLKNGGAAAIPDIGAARQQHPAKAIPRLTIVINWRPAGPLMVKADFDGIAVDMLPLLSSRDGGLSLVLPGSSVKGAIRAQAERIVRTLLKRELTGRFLTDLELPLIDDLFGLRGLSDGDIQRRRSEFEKRHRGRTVPDDGALGLAALSVDDCYGKTRLSRERWAAVRGATTDAALRNALEEAGLQPWSQAYHIAVDRWTGAAAESMLYTVLEPHRVEWEPLELEVDLGRLRDGVRLSAVALLLLVVRDLAMGRLPPGLRYAPRDGGDQSKIWDAYAAERGRPAGGDGRNFGDESWPRERARSGEGGVADLDREGGDMSEIKLFLHSSREGGPLPEALAAFAKVCGEAVGLLYSPRSCDFAMMSGGVLHGSDGRPVDLSAVYEARVFSENAELRWLNDPTHEKRHRAVILSEQDGPPPEGWDRSELKSVIEKLEQTYLLWGKGTEAKPPLADGWSLLATPRIGGLAVPVGGARSNRQRVLLHTLEYLTESDYGNVAVVEERLCRLEVVNG